MTLNYQCVKYENKLYMYSIKTANYHVVYNLYNPYKTKIQKGK